VENLSTITDMKRFMMKKVVTKMYMMKTKETAFELSYFGDWS
jgi:hypothetical protein